MYEGRELLQLVSAGLTILQGDECEILIFFTFGHSGVLLTKRCRPPHSELRFNWRFASTCRWFSTSGMMAGLGMGAKLKKTATRFCLRAMFQEIFPFTGTVSMVRVSQLQRFILCSSNIWDIAVGQQEQTLALLVSVALFYNL